MERKNRRIVSLLQLVKEVVDSKNRMPFSCSVLCVLCVFPSITIGILMIMKTTQVFTTCPMSIEEILKEYRKISIYALNIRMFNCQIQLDKNRSKITNVTKYLIEFEDENNIPHIFNFNSFAKMKFAIEMLECNNWNFVITDSECIRQLIKALYLIEFRKTNTFEQFITFLLSHI